MKTWADISRCLSQVLTHWAEIWKSKELPLFSPLVHFSGRRGFYVSSCSFYLLPRLAVKFSWKEFIIFIFKCGRKIFILVGLYFISVCNRLHHSNVIIQVLFALSPPLLYMFVCLRGITCAPMVHNKGVCRYHLSFLHVLLDLALYRSCNFVLIPSVAIGV